MTLATHIVIATAVAKPIASVSPILGFFVALASHYLSDAIPHWDYRLYSLADKDSAENRKFNFSKVFLKDLARIALDFFAGLAIVLFLYWPTTTKELVEILLLAAGGTLPDFLQGVYYTRRAEFLLPLQRFHDFMHTKIKLGPYPLLGVPFQGAIAIGALLLMV